jgi:hypothetical protein
VLPHTHTHTHTQTQIQQGNFRSILERVRTTYLRPYVTGNNDAILNEVGQTMAVSLVGAHQGPGVALDTAFGHLLVVLLGNVCFGVWISMTSQDWQLSFHKGQWRFYNRSLSRGGIMTLGHYYGLPRMNAGEHSYGGSSGYLSCHPRVLIRCHKPSGSTL